MKGRREMSIEYQYIWMTLIAFSTDFYKSLAVAQKPWDAQ